MSLIQVSRLSALSSLGSDLTPCPPGYRRDTLSAGHAASFVCVPEYEESIACRWFGWGCAQQLPSPRIASPQTPEQMTRPGAWTPEQSAEQTAANYREALRQYGEQNPDIAAVPATLFQTGEAVQDFARKAALPTALILLGVGAVVLLIAIKR